MMLLGLLYLGVVTVCGMAWKDRLLALCGLVLFGTVSQHPEMPTNIGEIPGLNPWNVCMLMIVVAWATHQGPELPAPPPWMGVLFGGYVLMLIVGAAVALFDMDTIVSRQELLASGRHIRNFEDGLKELFINPLKYLLMGWLIFAGCRDRKQAWQVIATLCILGVAFSLLTYKSLGTNIISGGHNDVRRLLSKLVGLHANDLAGLLTCCFWCCVIVGVVQRGRMRMLGVVGAILILPALVGCQSRAAYYANGLIAVTLAVVRWRWMFIGMPVAVGLVVALFPQIPERLMQGWDAGESAFEEDVDYNDVTAGRTKNIWEPFLEDIQKSPIIGHGRLSIARGTSMFEMIRREGVVPTHPHSSYLELIGDFGVVGLFWTLAMFFCFGFVALRMFLTKEDQLVQIAGGIGFVAVVNVLALGLSSSFFYPKESMSWLLASMALTTRIWSIYRARGAAPVESAPPASETPPLYGAPYPAVSYGRVPL
ncbi:MAG: O-antigen ligase family protein [Phycisphaerae bacterium]|nr:O-antigen ligase family protein [Phycisphaerae bacterium]